MRISIKNRWVFFSNPKTGSETLRCMLDPHSDPLLVQPVPIEFVDPAAPPFELHTRPHDARTVFEQRGWAWDEFFKFTTTRNPWAKLVSLYEHAKRLNIGLPEFQVWLDTIAFWAKEPASSAWFHVQDHRYWFDCARPAYVGSLVDVVVRLEHIEKDLPPVLARLGLPQGTLIPHENAGTHAAYETYYDDSTREIVRLLYAADIERFGYTFGR